MIFQVAMIIMLINCGIGIITLIGGVLWDI